MREEDYYPAGAFHDPRAPWNIQEPDMVNEDIDLALTLYTSASVEVREDAEPGEFIDAFYEQFPTVKDMLDDLAERYRKDIDLLKESEVDGCKREIKRLEKRIKYINSFNGEEAELQ